MRKKRSRLEMQLDVLETISQGVCKPTKIMHEANLQWTTLKQILNSLMRQNAVRKDYRGYRVYYSLTEKGERILMYLSVIQKLTQKI